MSLKHNSLLFSILVGFHVITITFIRAMQQTSLPPPRPPTRYVLPPERKFVELPVMDDFEQSDLCTTTSFGKFRVLQFNMLADGLSGLRQDLGAFSRVTADDMNWDKRGKLLLHEILQYDPDIITLQECDHYYDCFLPELNARGYDGMFAPKPASACLEVSDNSDGCAIFVRRSKMYITSFETITYTLSKTDFDFDDGVNDKDGVKDAPDMKSITASVPSNNSSNPSAPSSSSKNGDDDEYDAQIKAQNQVALILICELQQTKSSSSSSSGDQGTNPTAAEETNSWPVSPPLIVATTHLKASKNGKGELFRVAEANQLLSAVERANSHLRAMNRPPAILITGDLNASPVAVGSPPKSYEPLAYNAVKGHSLGLRSVLNDDFDRVRNKQRMDSYRLIADDLRGAPLTEVELMALRENDITIPAAAGEMMPSAPKWPASSKRANSIAGSIVGVSASVEEQVSGLELSSISSGEVWTSWKSRRKQGTEKVVKNCIDYILYAPLPNRIVQAACSSSNINNVSSGGGDLLGGGSNSSSDLMPIVGVRALGVLDLLTDEEVGPGFLPSPSYPSDHIAIAADFEIVSVTHHRAAAE